MQRGEDLCTHPRAEPLDPAGGNDFPRTPSITCPQGSGQGKKRAPLAENTFRARSLARVKAKNAAAGEIFRRRRFLLIETEAAEAPPCRRFSPGVSCRSGSRIHSPLSLRAQAAHKLGHTLAKKPGGFQIPRQGALFWASVHRRLSHQAGERAQPVNIVAMGSGKDIAWSYHGEMKRNRSVR